MTQEAEPSGPSNSKKSRGKPSLKLLNAELDNPTPGGGQKNRRYNGRQSTGPKIAEDLAKRDHGEIYPDCPVIALGVHGETFFYLDWLGQLQAVTNHTKDRMRGIFGGRSDILMDWFPQHTKGSNGPTGWAQEPVATQMVLACTEKGVWNAFEKVRGLGAWPDGEGGIILHCGDAVLHQGEWKTPGEIEGYVYPSAVIIPRPLDDLIEDETSNPGQELLELLGTWNWLREDVDAYLLLGWICGAIFGGALDWRPLIWITGDMGTGKSTVHKLIRHVMGGEGAILQSTDATEASVRQFLMQSTVPVALDEIEAESDGRKVQAVVKLARQAASGGVILRGGADHKGQEFKARSSFLFSSILVPPLLDQDISRIALLELNPLDNDTPPPAIEPRHWTKIGRGLRTRVIDGWDRLHDTLELYRQALASQGHTKRGCDQFGTLLALADLALYDATPSPDRCELWAEKLSAAVIDDQMDQASDWERCLNHLFGQQLDVYRGGERQTVGQYVLKAAEIVDSGDPKKAQRALASAGMRVYGQKDNAQLAIANAHPGLAALFEGTQWHASAGQRGVWAQAIKRIPDSFSTGSLRFDLVGSRARRFPLRNAPAFLDEQTATQSAQPAASPHVDPPNDFNDFG